MCRSSSYTTDINLSRAWTSPLLQSTRSRVTSLGCWRSGTLPPVVDCQMSIVRCHVRNLRADKLRSTEIYLRCYVRPISSSSCRFEPVERSRHGFLPQAVHSLALFGFHVRLPSVIHGPLRPEIVEILKESDRK